MNETVPLSQTFLRQAVDEPVRDLRIRCSPDLGITIACIPRGVRPPAGATSSGALLP